MGVVTVRRARPRQRADAIGRSSPMAPGGRGLWSEDERTKVKALGTEKLTWAHRGGGSMRGRRKGWAQWLLPVVRGLRWPSTAR
jgi:hypothetical protein